MLKSEAASWFRIFEMFHFEAFHMYGIIGSALFSGVIGIQLIKRFTETQFISQKKKRKYSYLFGRIILGLGWAIAGACTGPMFTLLNISLLPIIILIVSATSGTFVYGFIKNKLPH